MSAAFKMCFFFCNELFAMTNVVTNTILQVCLTYSKVETNFFHILLGFSPFDIQMRLNYTKFTENCGARIVKSELSKRLRNSVQKGM